jgi:hypothetical protein
MCYYLDHKLTYKGCTAESKHVVTRRDYDTKGCEQYK